MAGRDARPEEEGKLSAALPSEEAVVSVFSLEYLLVDIFLALNFNSSVLHLLVVTGKRKVTLEAM